MTASCRLLCRLLPLAALAASPAPAAHRPILPAQAHGSEGQKLTIVPDGEGYAIMHAGSPRDVAGAKATTGHRPVVSIGAHTKFDASLVAPAALRIPGGRDASAR